MAIGSVNKSEFINLIPLLNVITLRKDYQNRHAEKILFEPTQRCFEKDAFSADKNYPPAIAPTMRNGSFPATTASGNRASGGS